MDRAAGPGRTVSLPDRVVLVDKPVGPSSYDMIRLARRGRRGRIGHAGTLDPFASGLLLLMTGNATRLSALLMALPKEYELTVQFGAESSTGDPTGDIIRGGAPVTLKEVVAALDRFRGSIVQKVPLTSAVKVGGEPLYKRAHRGEKAETPERLVQVYDLTLTHFDVESQQAQVLALVGSGTYLRVLAADLGAAVGSRAYASALRRTRVGCFSVVDAVAGEELCADLLESTRRGVLSLDEALAFLPRYQVGGSLARRAANGNVFRPFPEGRFRVYEADRLLGVFAGREGAARPLVMFPKVG